MGGGVFVNSVADFTIQGSAFHQNTAQSTCAEDPSKPPAQQGFGLQFACIPMTGVRYVSQPGGGIQASLYAAIHAYDYIDISFNTAEQGGGLYIESRCSARLYNGGRLHMNIAAKEGGGIMLQSASDASKRAEFFARRVEVDSNLVKQFAGGGISASTHSLVELYECRITCNVAALGNGGGIYAANSTVVVANASELKGNFAEIRGGAAYLLGNNSTFEMASSNITANRAAQQGGGIAMLAGVTAAVHRSSRISWNTALEAAAISAISSNLRLTASAIIGNSAGGVRLSYGSAADVEEMTFEQQEGTALLVGNGSRVSIYNTAFVANSAPKVENGWDVLDDPASGMGLVCEADGAAVLEQCLFERNRGRSGAAAVLAGNAQIMNCSFVHNAADSSGAVYIFLQGEIALHLVTFKNNSAHNGAALYLVEVHDQGRDDSAAALFSQLRYEYNNATGGGSVGFWEPLDLFANESWPPECTECTYKENAAGYSTEGGWAGAAMLVHVESRHPEQRGEYRLDDPIVVELIDMFGTVVTDRTQVTLSTACPVSGALKAATKDGVAVFDDLVLSGAPGSECAVQLSAALAQTEVSASSIVPLRTCWEGERYDAGAQKCTECEENTLSMRNDTEECVDCTDEEGIYCSGGSSYEILEGFWMAPVAQACEDTDCFTSRIYQCAQAAACSTMDKQRRGTGMESLGALELCAVEEGYTSGVLCGGTSTVVCGAGHHANVDATECLQCPDKESVVMQTIIACIALVALFMAATTYLLHRAASFDIVEQAVGAIEEVQEMQENGEYLVQVTRVSRVVGLLLGYMQVMGQFVAVFPGEIIPDSLVQCLNRLFVVNVNVSNLSFFANMECTAHYQGGGVMSSFELAFVVTLCAPWGLMVTNWICYQVYVCYLRMTNHGIEVAHLEGVKAACYQKLVSATFFLLTLMHPTISTMAMQVFNCDEYWYTELKVQYWVSQGSDTECSTPRWWFLVSLSLITTVLYIVGYPMGIFVCMYRARRWLKCRLKRDDVRTHSEWMRHQGWTLVGKEVFSDLEYAERETIELPESIAMQEEGVIDGDDNPVRPKAERPESKSKPSEVSHAEDDFRDEDPAGEQARAEKGTPRTAALSKHSGVEAYVDMFISVNAVTYDTVDLADGGGGTWEVEGKKFAGTDSVSRSSEEEILEATLTTVIVGDGEPCFVRLFKKYDEGDNGVISLVPVTYLDSAHVQQVLGSGFTNPFEDGYFFWQCYEIVRRLLQTGGVLVVRMAFGLEAAVAYALVLSMVALCNHLYFRPYTNDNDDLLMMVILINQCICQFFLLCLLVSNKSSEAFGAVMVTMQVVLVVYGLSMSAPAVFELVAHVASSEKVRSVSRRLSEQLPIQGFSINAISINDVSVDFDEIAECPLPDGDEITEYPLPDGDEIAECPLPDGVEKAECPLPDGDEVVEVAAPDSNTMTPIAPLGGNTVAEFSIHQWGWIHGVHPPPTEFFQQHLMEVPERD
eukprot:gene1086-1637_t